jgi:integrase
MITVTRDQTSKVPAKSEPPRLVKNGFGHLRRAPELIALQWDQIDLKGRNASRRQTEDGSPSPHPLRGPELRALRAWKREQGDSTPYVFTSLRGGPMTRRTVHYVVAEAAKAAGIEFPVHPHMLRHATGFYLANAGQDTRAIQLYLGHKNIQHTVCYTELAAGRFKDFWKD